MICVNNGPMRLNGRWFNYTPPPPPPPPPVYNVYTSGNHGVVVATPNSGISGTEVTLTNIPASGYTFDSYSVTGATLKNDNQFDIVNSDVYVHGNFKDPYNPLDLPPYTIRVAVYPGQQPVYNHNGLPTEIANLMTWTCVDAEENIWDFHFPYNDWGTYPNASASRLGSGDRIYRILGFNATGITSMYGLFYNFTMLSTIPLFDTSTVTDMTVMFKGSAVHNIATLDTSNVTTMQGMFANCSSLYTIPQFNTSKVTTMEDMFCMDNVDTGGLAVMPLIDTSSVTNMSHMFTRCSRLKTVALLNTQNVTNMNSMFERCKALTTLPTFDTRNVTQMRYMLYACWQRTWDGTTPIDVGLQSIPYFNTAKVTDCDYMCGLCCMVADDSAYKLYYRMASQAVRPTSHQDTFAGCGMYTTAGAAALAQIPSSWK